MAALPHLLSWTSHCEARRAAAIFNIIFLSDKGEHGFTPSRINRFYLTGWTRFLPSIWYAEPAGIILEMGWHVGNMRCEVCRSGLATCMWEITVVDSLKSAVQEEGRIQEWRQSQNGSGMEVAFCCWFSASRLFLFHSPSYILSQISWWLRRMIRRLNRINRKRPAVINDKGHRFHRLTRIWFFHKDN